jgi:ABC-type nitrate/sulfonate/bicarbonate transport system substrate-binding protein
VQNFGSGLKVVQAVVSGGVDIGASSIEPVVSASTRGQKLPIIGAYTDRLAVSMVTPKKITDPAQLRDKRLGIQDVGAFREVMTRLVLKNADLTPKDVSYRPVESNGYTGALLAGQIQSGILQQEQAVEAMGKDKGFHVLQDLYKTDPDYFYGTYFSKEQWLKGNDGSAERFLAAITQAHRFMYENKAETVKIVAKTTGFSPKVISKAYAHLLTQNAVFPVNDGLDEGRLNHTLGRMKELGLIQGDPPQAADVVDRGPIEGALKRIGCPARDPRLES